MRVARPTFQGAHASMESKALLLRTNYVHKHAPP